MSKDQLIRDALLSSNAIAWPRQPALTERFPDRAVVEGGDRLFNVEAYAAGGLCTVAYQEIVHNQTITHWQGREMAMPTMPMMMLQMSRMMSGGFPGSADGGDGSVVERPKNAWVRVEWQGRTYEVVLMTWLDAMGPVFQYWIVADRHEQATDLIQAVCRWNAEIRGEVLVFDGGCWHKDAQLFQAIQGATYGNLILQGHLSSRTSSTISSSSLPHGSQASDTASRGNGACSSSGHQATARPTRSRPSSTRWISRVFYVKSFRSEHVPEEANIRQVFDQFGDRRPAFSCSADLDALVNGQNRSFFLNELDGFAANVGVITIATTNHPERLDVSIVDRPSRFDRKYPFDLPAPPERLAHIRMWNASLAAALRMTEESIAAVAELTDGFSFAYLKELFLCSMMRWIANHEQGAMEQTMVGQVPVLRAQMSSVDQSAEPVAEGLPHAMQRGMGWVTHMVRTRGG